LVGIGKLWNSNTKIVPLRFCCKKIKNTITWVLFKEINSLLLGGSVFIFIY